MRLTPILAVCAMLAGVTAPAHAQETGTLMKHRAAQIGDARGPGAARMAMNAFAACLVDRQPGRTAKMIAMPVDGEEYQSFIRKIAIHDENCMFEGRMSMSEQLLRGAFFQAFYLQDFGKGGPVTFDPAVQSKYRDIYPINISAQGEQAVAMEQFGECVARADGASLRKLLISLPGSSDETESFVVLNPRFSACIPNGMKFEFSKAILKGVLAEGMYRLSKANETKEAAK